MRTSDVGSKMTEGIEQNYNASVGMNDSLNIENIVLEKNDTAIPEFLTRPNYSVILVYSALFVVAAIGNLTVFFSLFRSRHRKSRISLMIRHLAIADLIVTFVMIPIEVSWRLTGSWIAGNVACKVFLFLRALGPYLSSNVLVCVSLDRYFAVLHPLKVNDARRRGKVMLAVAWGASFVYCIPQAFVFRVMVHPKYPTYTQCVSFGFFTSHSQEIAYNLMSVMFLYFIPLFVIIVSYTAIMCEISKNSKGTLGDSYRASNGRMRLRRSDISNIARARSRTLRMTITIVAVYIWCCTPYVIITLWYMFDRKGASSLPEWLQDTFFIMVVSNSCMNPVVYGSYVMGCRQLDCSCFSCFKKNPTETRLNNGDAQMAAGQSRQIARRVIKCVLGLKKELQPRTPVIYSFPGHIGHPSALLSHSNSELIPLRTHGTLGMQQVGSGTTRSTALGNAITRPTVDKSPTKITGPVIKRGASSKEHPTSVGHISFFSDRRPSRSYRASFHSEPLTNPYPFLEQQTLGMLSVGCTSSEPNMSPKGNIKINGNETEIYCNRVYNERTRTRNI